METVVVSVGSYPSSDSALKFAVEEASRRGASLRVIYAWEPPVMSTDEIYVPVFAYYETLREEAETLLQEALARAAALQPTLACEGRIFEGVLAAVLLEEARHAALVVVVSNRRRSWTSVLTGSLIDYLGRRASCAVTVVPHETC